MCDVFAAGGEEPSLQLIDLQFSWHKLENQITAIVIDRVLNNFIKIINDTQYLQIIIK
jgi:hypothetical protein